MCPHLKTTCVNNFCPLSGGQGSCPNHPNKHTPHNPGPPQLFSLCPYPGWAPYLSICELAELLLSLLDLCLCDL
jgi:hypothetical protein